jgi:hypothetical protein
LLIGDPVQAGVRGVTRAEGCPPETDDAHHVHSQTNFLRQKEFSGSGHGAVNNFAATVGQK